MHSALKRFFDFSISSVLLFFLMPLIAFLVLGVLYDLGRPILFQQWRPGLKGKKFRIIKFRTMHFSNDLLEDVSNDGDRLTSFGLFLRRTSLDELPELWNVVKGDMSLVGPRPLLMEYLELYDDYQMQRHEMKPGITGLAQINGRNKLEWSEKFELDVWYVKNWSFFLDLKILFKSFVVVFMQDGINYHGTDTAKKFDGKCL